MIMIRTDGTFVPGNAWLADRGIVIEDKESPYGIDFGIALFYTEKQREQWKQILQLKNRLLATDYWDNKYIEGEFSEEEWAEKRAQRAAWRSEIREIEKDFIKPTITREEMNEAERKALEKLKGE